MTSSPPRPLMTSLPLLPTMMSLPGVPLITPAPEIVAGTFPTPKTKQVGVSCADAAAVTVRLRSTPSTSKSPIFFMNSPYLPPEPGGIAIGGTLADPVLGLADDVAGLRHRLDRILRFFDRVFRHRDRHGIVFAVADLGVDPRRAEDPLDLFGLRDVAGDR